MTEHFKFSELCVTSTGLPNDAPLSLAGNLMRLCQLLEEVRELCGNFPIRINSGYRSPAVNHKAGGAPNSQHLKGQAADFVPGGVSIQVAFDLIRNSAIQFDQLILEPGWVHISVPDAGKEPRLQSMVANRGPNGMVYREVPRV